MNRVLSMMKRLRYRQQQKRNLLYPNEEYIASEANINKADLHRLRFVYDLHKDLNGVMLDIGCNDGFFMRAFDWSFESFVGVDLFSIDRYTRGRLREDPKLYTRDGRIRYVTGCFEDMASSLGVFDFVFAGEVIEHADNECVFMNALSKTVKESSRWCLTTPNDIGAGLPEHNRQYSADSLRELISRYFSEFKIENLASPGDSWPFLVAHGSGKRA